MNSWITQVLAATLILLSFTKLVVVLIKRGAWLGFAKRLYATPTATSAVSLGIAGVVLLLLIRSGLDIVQILAVCLFVVFLMIVGVAPYAPRLFAWLEMQDVQQMIRRQWLHASVWIALLCWGAYSLLA